MIRSLLSLALVLFGCGYAILRGGAPERVVGSAYLAGAFLTILALSPLSHRFSGVEEGVMLIDLALLIIMMAIALFSERYWPIWMTAMQAMTVLAHLGRLMPQVKAWTYWNAVTLWSYPILLLLIVATRRHQMRVARTGADSSWRSFSGRSMRSAPTRPPAS